MALIHCTVPPRMIAANRANAQRSTGPRTARGKAESRLNALRSGACSCQLIEYLHFWFEILLADPRQPPPPWKISEMPVPRDWTHACGPRPAREIRGFLRKVEGFLRPHSGSRPAGTRAIRETAPPKCPAGGRKTKEFFF